MPPTVYPRVGGETPSDRRMSWRTSGLSPRGRGNHEGRGHRYPVGRSIPAWAGKPGVLYGCRLPSAVYPRVGGETDRRVISLPISVGLSPRGRGNPKPERPQHRMLGSIPAWAGKPLPDGGIEHFP